VTVTVSVVEALFDLVLSDGVEVVNARFAALPLWPDDDVSVPDILVMFASLLIFTMPWEFASARMNDLLAFIAIPTTAVTLSNNKTTAT